MLAHLQKLTTLAVFVLACVWASWWWADQHQAVVAVVGAGLIFFCYAPVMVLEMALLRLTHGRDRCPRADWQMLAKAWLGEVLLAPRVFYWRQPFRSRRFADALSPGRPVRAHGVLLVHGFACNRGFWNPWLGRMAEAGVPYIAVNLEPIFGSIDRHVEQLDAAALRLQAATGLPPLVVGHSMGGLAIRAWLRAKRREGLVHRVITIGTPHHGTWLARWGRTTNTRQMRQGSKWLLELSRGETAADRARFTCFYSNCDNIVFPPSSATLPDADNRFIAGWSHVHLAFHPDVFDEVIRQLTPDPAAPRGASGPVRCSGTAP